MKAKIKNVQGNGNWESKYGLLYSFEIELSDGVIGTANGKTPEYRFKVGDEVEYEISGKSPKGVSNLKISKPDSDFTPQSNPTQKGGGTSDSILMQVCLKEVSALIQTDFFSYDMSKTNIERIELMADLTLTMAQKVKSNLTEL